jgi:hypothetical protein
MMAIEEDHWDRSTMAEAQGGHDRRLSLHAEGSEYTLLGFHR